MAAELLSPMLVRATELASSSEPFFFPEYTDHSTAHIEDVLGAALDLIHDNSIKTISDNDYCILALAVILHDIGLHLRAEGFMDLLQSGPGPLTRFDHGQPSWAQLWEDFLSEALRFDERRLVEIFNSADPIRRPPGNILDWSLRDRLLIGEFLRHHHARLSHEIAISGFPIGRGEYRQLLGAATRELRDLVGLIARSHGISVRETLPYISQHFDLRDYNGIHIIYVMTLLRVADYLQIQPTRAPANLRDVRRIRSPISNREWITHACIKNISVADLDPEAINILAEPPDVKTYLRVRNWLDGIQAEMDLSWAILGETYGRFSSPEPKNDLANLKLRLRRIKSNIDDITQFSATIPYLPQHVTFASAGSDLLKLLIGPLYNYNAFIGIRELFQNAADAVRELADILSHEPSLEVSLHSDLSKVGVEIELGLANDEIARIEIRDSGVGMNADIIVKYFLTAGASFRNSEIWRSLHEKDDHSRVARGGRFGVGALASFLLGQRISVHTRHYTASDTDSIYFEGDISSTAIELIRKPKTSIGTAISIELMKPMNLRQFKSWVEANIFQSDVPILVLNCPKIDDKHIQLKTVPRSFEFDTPILFGWSDQSISVGASLGNTSSDLIVNAIKISSDLNTESKELGLYFGYFSLKAPDIIIWDRDAVFPLNLQRNAASFEKFAQKEKLGFVIIAEVLAKLVAYKAGLADWLFAADLHERFPTIGGSSMVGPFEHFGGTYYESQVRELALAKTKILFANYSSFLSHGVSNVIVIAAPGIRSANPLRDIIDKDTAICLWPTYNRPDDTASKYSAVLKRGHLWVAPIYGKVTSFLISKQVANRFSSFKRPPPELDTLKEIAEFNGDILAPVDDIDDTLLRIALILRRQQIKVSIIFQIDNQKMSWDARGRDAAYARFIDVAKLLLGSDAIGLTEELVISTDLESTRYFKTRVEAYLSAPLKQARKQARDN
jgi:hypothetical protein